MSDTAYQERLLVYRVDNNLTLNIPPAAELLCSILNFDHPDMPGLGRIAPGDWQPILDLARQQNLLPILYHRIQAAGLCDEVPAEIRSILHGQYLRSAARGIRINRQFDAILDELNSANLPVIPLKGMYLMQAIYQNPALRPMGDIDLLIKTQDSPMVVAILRSLGYQAVRPYILRSEYRFHRHLPSFVKQGAIPIEVHNALQEPGDPYDIDSLSLWNRSNELYQGNYVMKALDLYDMLQYLCINVAFHDLFRAGLMGLYDLGTVITHFEGVWDWDELYKRCMAWRTNHLVHITLSLARGLLGVNIPTEFLSSLAPPNFDEDLFSICADFIFASPSEADPPVTPNLDQLVRIVKPLAKVRILINRLFIPRAEITNYYNVPPGSWKIFGCYLQRFIYLVKRYFVVSLRLSRGDSNLMAVSEEVRIQDHRRRLLIESLL